MMANLTAEQKRSLGRVDICKRIRQQLGQEFPGCTFSVVSSAYSGGYSITISLMQAPFRVIKRFEEIPESAFLTSSGYNKEDVARNQKETYHQLNPYALMKPFTPNEWNNGVFLTEKAHRVLSRVVQISDQYNWDRSDPQSDHFDVNFYLHMEIGKWDRPFINGG